MSGNARIKFSYDTDEGAEITEYLVAKWEVCSQCQGNGKSSAYLGAITEEDREQNWSPEEFEEYMRGGYDKTCDECNGRRVVAVLDEARNPPELVEKYLKHLEDESEYRSICRMERRMGA